MRSEYHLLHPLLPRTPAFDDGTIEGVLQPQWSESCSNWTGQQGPPGRGGGPWVLMKVTLFGEFEP